MIGHLVYHSDSSRAFLQALAEGMRAHGDSAYLTTGGVTLREADFVASWGQRVVLDTKKPRLYLEAGYINGDGESYVEQRLRFVSCEWNGLGGLADPLGDCPSDRWDALSIELKPLKDVGHNLLVLEQNPDDSAANGPFLTQAARSMYWCTVRFRPHPTVQRTCWLGWDLRWADVALSYASTAAVEALIAGVRTIALSDRSVAADIAYRDQSAPWVCEYPDDRAAWFARLAYRQWTLQELRSGQAWEFLRPRCKIRACASDAA